MASTATAAPGNQSSASERFTVTLRGREYPLADGAKEQAVSDPGEKRRNAAIVDRLWTELPIVSLDANCSDRTQIVKAYTESISRLVERNQEVERLFATMCRVNLQVRAQGRQHADVRQQAQQAKEREMFERGRFAPFLDDGTLTAELAAQPPELVRLHLNESLRTISEAFVREIFAALDRFVSADTVGLIDWFGETDDVCKFHFFSETVVQTEKRSRRRRGRERRGREVNDRQVEILQDVTHQSDGVHVHVHARHEHHLMNARSHAPGEQALVVPETATRLIDVIPEWLHPLVRIVEGDRIRERIIEREVRTDKWRKKHRETTRRLESVHYHIDPAVTLDCYVLTGWGECAIREEEERRELRRQDQQRAERETARAIDAVAARKRLWLATGATALFQAVALAVVILSVIAPPLVIAAALIMLAGLVPAGIALRLLAVARVRQPDWKYLTTGSAAALMISAGVQLLVLGTLQPALPLIGLGAVCLISGGVFARQTMVSFRLLRELPY